MKIKRFNKKLDVQNEFLSVGEYVFVTSDYHSLHHEPVRITAEVDEDLFECVSLITSEYYEVSLKEIDSDMTEEEIELYKATTKYNL